MAGCKWRILKVVTGYRNPSQFRRDETEEPEGSGPYVFSVMDAVNAYVLSPMDELVVDIYHEVYREYFSTNIPLIKDRRQTLWSEIMNGASFCTSWRWAVSWRNVLWHWGTSRPRLSREESRRCHVWAWVHCPQVPVRTHRDSCRKSSYRIGQHDYGVW